MTARLIKGLGPWVLCPFLFAHGLGFEQDVALDGALWSGFGRFLMNLLGEALVATMVEVGMRQAMAKNPAALTLAEKLPDHAKSRVLACWEGHCDCAVCALRRNLEPPPPPPPPPL